MLSATPQFRQLLDIMIDYDHNFWRNIHAQFADVRGWMPGPRKLHAAWSEVSMSDITDLSDGSSDRELDENDVSQPISGPRGASLIRC